MTVPSGAGGRRPRGPWVHAVARTLTFSHLRRLNLARTHQMHVGDRNVTDDTVELAVCVGRVAAAADRVRHSRRPADPPQPLVEDLADAVANVVLIGDQMLARYGVDLAMAVLRRVEDDRTVDTVPAWRPGRHGERAAGG